jgi:hypothetical protein
MDSFPYSFRNPTEEHIESLTDGLSQELEKLRGGCSFALTAMVIGSHEQRPLESI